MKTVRCCLAHARGNDGMLSLEAVLVLPVLAVVVALLLNVVAFVADVLLIHDAARAGARAAATSSQSGHVVEAVRAAAPELADAAIQVVPLQRRSGDVVTVTVSSTASIGPYTHDIESSVSARVEPGVGGG